MAKMYRSSQGKSVDLGALLLQNENVRAVGNMGVNARGDRIDNKGKSIDSRVQQKKRQYNKQIGPQDVTPSESRNIVADIDPIFEPAVKEVATSEKKPAKKTVTKKKTPVIHESIIDVEPTVEAKPKASGLADAIARAKLIKQQAIVPPRQLAKEQSGVKKI